MKSISLPPVKMLIEKKTGSKVKLISNIGGSSDLRAFVNTDIQLSELFFNEESELIAKDRDGNKVDKGIRCILLDSDFADDEMTQLSLTGIENGVLVIDGETVDGKDLAFLVENS
jgi:hypothetical protein